jgi:TonB family protein
MFAELQYRDGGRWRGSHAFSIAVHAAIVLTIFITRPVPRFLVPSYLMRGNGGQAMTTIYLDGHGQDDVPAPVVAKKAASKPAPQTVSKHLTLPREPDQKQEIAAATPAARPGSPSGSSLYGSTIGHDIRPALPVVGPRPSLTAEDLPQGVQGDVVVEITIDERGTITGMRFVKKLGYGIDEKVLAALEQWHFTPATQDGVAIPSQQLVLFHFPS